MICFDNLQIQFRRNRLWTFPFFTIVFEIKFNILMPKGSPQWLLSAVNILLVFWKSKPPVTPLLTSGPSTLRSHKEFGVSVTLLPFINWGRFTKLKGNQPWIYTGRTDAEAEAPILWPSDEKSQPFGKDPDAGKSWRQEEKGATENEMVGWHHRLNGHEFEQALGDGEGQESLACCSPWGCKESVLT